MPLLLDGEVDGLHRDLVLLRRSLDVLVQLFVLDRLQTLPLALPSRSRSGPETNLKSSLSIKYEIINAINR